MGAKPYKRMEEDGLATLLCASLVLIFVFCSLLKIASLSAVADPVLSDSMRRSFKVESAVVAVGMTLTILLALVVMLVMTAREMVVSVPAPRSEAVSD